VDCPGRVLNNCRPFDEHNYSFRGKVDYLKDYRFTIAFENQSTVGYTTEKIIHPFIAGSIPIYWGNPKVAELFNPEAFINCHDFDDFESVISHVIQVDNDPVLQAKYRRARPVVRGSLIDRLSKSFLEEKVRLIGNGISAECVSRRKTFPLRARYHWLSYRLGNRALALRQRMGFEPRCWD
jgi:hypothetical protein